MSHPLEQRIGLLRARLRRLLTLYGLSWVAAVLLGSLLVLGSIDYLLRFQDRGLRVMASGLLWAALGWTCYRCLIRALTLRLRDVDLAARLERRFPDLQDRLLSSVEFLRQAEDDPLAGSAALRRAVIAQTAAETEPLDFSKVLDTRPPLRAAMTVTAIGLVAAILVVLNPAASETAVARLINPFSSLAWPQRTHLVVRSPVSRIAKGQPFEVEVTAAADTKLPPEVRINYRFENADGTETEESEPMRPAGDVMLARRENVQRSFSYRVEGGDDQSMPWNSVEVVAPPAIKALTIRLIPPQYTGWPPQSSEPQIRALVGTRIEMTAETSKPLQAAALRLDDDRLVAGRVSADGYRFALPAPGEPELQVEKSGSYWFELTDREGLGGGRDTRWEIHAIPDAPPSVSIEEPAANLYVTARAEVPLRITAKDDLAIREIALVYTVFNSAAATSSLPLGQGQGEGAPPRSPRPLEESRGDGASQMSPLPLGEGQGESASRETQPAIPLTQREREGETVVTLYAGPQRVEPLPAGQLPGGPDSGDRRAISYRWKLEALRIPAGSQVSFYAAATDYRPQAGRSEPRRLFVITPEELQQRIASRQGQVLAELERVLKMQRGGRAQVQSLAIRLAETGRVEQVDVDHLQAAELNQREVGRSLTSRSEGVSALILALLADLENNQVDSPDVTRRMQTILQEMNRLDRQHLPIIGQELMAAVKAAQVRVQEQAGGPPLADVAGPLTAAGKGQDEVIASLEQLLGQLAQWDNYRRFYRQLAQLLRDQEDIARGTAELGRHTLTKDLKDLTPQETAELKTRAAQQLDLGRRLDRILPAMEQAGVELRQTDPLAAETIADALAAARRLGISGQMRTCGGNLQDNQLGQAAQRQKTISENLQQVLEILANRRQQELGRLVKNFQQSQKDLAEMERQQAALKRQMETNVQDADQARRRTEAERLGRQQAQLKEQTEGIARRLERLLAEQAGRTTQQAAGHMGQATQCATGGDQQGAVRQAAAAQQSLQDARRQLAAQDLQSQSELALEQLARLEDAVKHLHRQQQTVIAETERLDALRNSQGQLPRAQAAALGELAGLERSLESETMRLGDDFQALGTFFMALSGAGRVMGRSAALLERDQTGAATQEAEKTALGRLALLLEALKPETPPSQPNDAGHRAGEQPQQPSGAQHALAEWKLLRLLQQEINLRTRQLQRTVERSGQLSDQQRRQYASLAEEQGRLADLLLQWLRRELGPAALSEDDNPLLPIARQMRQAEGLIRRHDSGAATQELQRSILSELQQLLEQAGKACAQSQPAGTSQQPPPRPPSGAKPSPPKPGGQKSNPGATPGITGAKRNGSGQSGQPDAAEARQLMEKVWGTLPQHERQQVRQMPAEEFLPKYRPLIEEYFRRLSEEKGGGTKSSEN